MGVAGSGFLWGGSLEGVAVVQASRCSHTQGAQRPAGEKVTALGLLRQTPGDMFQGGYIPLHLRKLPPGCSTLSNRMEEKVSKRKETGIASDSESRAWGGRALPLCTHSALGTAAACVARAGEVWAPQGEERTGFLGEGGHGDS